MHHVRDWTHSNGHGNELAEWERKKFDRNGRKNDRRFDFDGFHWFLVGRLLCIWNCGLI